MTEAFLINTLILLKPLTYENCQNLPDIIITICFYNFESFLLKNFQLQAVQHIFHKCTPYTVVCKMIENSESPENLHAPPPKILHSTVQLFFLLLTPQIHAATACSVDATDPI